MISLKSCHKSCLLMALSGAIILIMTHPHHKLIPAAISDVGFKRTSPGDLRLYHQSTGAKLVPETTECTFPQVDPFDPSIMKIAGLKKGPLNCRHYFLPEITYIAGLSIRVDASRAKIQPARIRCKYRNITGMPLNDNKILFSNWSQIFTESIGITKEHEFLQVECFDSQVEGKIISKAFYSLVPERAHLNSLYEAAIIKRLIEFKPKETLNLIAVGLDGLPRHQMLRAMPKTYKFLMGLKSFDFTKHGQTGKNTLPNLLTLLSPNNLTEIKKWWSPGEPEDTFDLIWHNFEQAGYRTLFTEDNPRQSGFYFGGGQFVFPQTSYWNRPLEIAMNNEGGFVRRKGLCNGPHSVSEYQLSYLIRFLDTFRSDPVTGWTMISDVTHNDITNAGLIDQDILNFYKTLEAKGQLNKSVVLFFSDHGSRWGKIRRTYNGIVEGRNPFMILTFPLWFLKKYPEIAKNLKTNTHRLTSHFDTRQTLLDLLYFKAQTTTPPFRGKYGLSLFHEIPANRTCSDASIPEEHCLCGQKVDRFLNLTSPEAVALSKALMSAVKQKSDPKKCKEYSLDKILQVGVLALPVNMEKVEQKMLMCNVRISVKPGGAIFEATVTMDQETKKTSVSSNLDRLNLYKGEVECQPTSKQQMFCYCKSNPTKS